MADRDVQGQAGSRPFRPLPVPPIRQKNKQLIQAAIERARNELTDTQVIAIMDCGSVQTIAALLKDTQHHLTNPLITCLICIHPYHSANVEGNIEVPVTTACGHIFGNTCIASWLTPESDLTCPFCRFELRYKECNHPISPVSAFSPPPPPKITAEQIPARCGVCELDLLMEEKRLLIALERDQKDSLEVDMLDLRETGAKVTPEGEFTLLTDEEFQEQEPELWAEITKLAKLVAASDDKIKIMEEELEEDTEAERLNMRQEIARRGGWYM
jgi:Ring finger domain